MIRRIHRSLVINVSIWEGGDDRSAERALFAALDEAGAKHLVDYDCVVDEQVQHLCAWLPESMRAALSPLAFGEAWGSRRFIVHTAGRRYVSDGSAQYLIENGDGALPLPGTRIIKNFDVTPIEVGTEPVRVVLADLPRLAIGKVLSHQDPRAVGRVHVDANLVEAALLLYPERGEWFEARLRENYFDALLLKEGDVLLAVVMGLKRETADVSPTTAEDGDG